MDRKLKWTSSLAFLLASLVVGLPGRAATLDFDSFAPGEVLTAQPELRSAGINRVSPMEIIDCATIPNCTAHSGDQVASGVAEGEFARRPIEISFSVPQQSIRFRARSEYSEVPAQNLTLIVMLADASGSTMGTAQFGLTSNQEWTEYIIENNNQVFSRVTITVDYTTNPSGSHNLIVMDDLVFDGQQIEDQDDLPPDISILIPSPDTVVDGSFDTALWVRDDLALSRVTAELTLDSNGTLIGATHFCGTPYSLDSACPPEPLDVYLRQARIHVKQPEQLLFKRAGHTSRPRLRCRIELLGGGTGISSEHGWSTPGACRDRPSARRGDTGGATPFVPST